jgi:2'-5' RNA ligase
MFFFMNSKLWSITADISTNLFFAALPPEPLRPIIAGLGAHIGRAHRLRGAMIAKELLHNTLAPACDPRFSLEKNIERARRVGADMRHPSFAVRFDWTQSFRASAHRHPFVLSGDDGLMPLRAFRQVLREGMLRAGFTVPQSHTPHITLLWADRCVGEHPIAPIGWEIRDFVLVLSLRGMGSHITVARWTLH